MKIFLSGGTGFVGGHLRKALLDKGYGIRLLVHKRGGDFGEGVEQVEGDATIPATFADALRGCDAVANLVGIIREFPGRGVTFEMLHLEATRNLVDAAVKGGVKRYLQMSALGTRRAAASDYHRTKFMAEEYLRGSGLDWTIFRPSLIFGPKDEFVNRLAGFVGSLPAVPVIGDGGYRLQPIYGDDVARCFAMALEMPETVGKIYELCGPERFTYIELLDAVGSAVGKPVVKKALIPLAVMRLIVPLFQKLPFFPVTMDQITMLQEESICDGAWRDTFGFEPQRLAGVIAGYLGER